MTVINHNLFIIFVLALLVLIGLGFLLFFLYDNDSDKTEKKRSDDEARTNDTTPGYMSDTISPLDNAFWDDTHGSKRISGKSEKEGKH